MLYTGDNYHVESYKEYKNRTFSRHIDKVNNQLMQIKQCSLKEEDKEKLRKQMLDAIYIYNF